MDDAVRIVLDDDCFVIQLNNDLIVRHGTWSEKQVTYTDKFGDFHAGYQCSCCDAITLKSPYCSQCGAKMDNYK